MEIPNSLSRRASIYAEKCHREANHLYDGKPYTYHLCIVNEVALKFIHLIPGAEQEEVLAGGWVHDVIEDTRQTYNDVKTATSKPVAELAYALTNNKGKNRKQRAGSAYYMGIRSTRHATFIKLCDRVANVRYSINEGSSRMAQVYVNEHPEFKRALRPGFLSWIFSSRAAGTLPVLMLGALYAFLNSRYNLPHSTFIWVIIGVIWTFIPFMLISSFIIDRRQYKELFDHLDKLIDNTRHLLTLNTVSDNTQLNHEERLKRLKLAKGGTWEDGWVPYCVTESIPCSNRYRMLKMDYGFRCPGCGNMVGWDLRRLRESPLNEFYDCEHQPK